MHEMSVSPDARWREFYYATQDGLKLYGREYGNRRSPLTPVVCLSGLSRNSKDFHGLAETLAVDRRVLALDYRGRGRSEYAQDPATYSPFIELLDTLAALDAAAIEHAVIIGTSRGGIIAMMMGAARPTALRGVILNDVGPEIEPPGLLRIAEYLNDATTPDNWAHAAKMVRDINEAGFTDLDEADWDALARRTYRDDDGTPASDFDPELARLLSENLKASNGKVPALWPQFRSLCGFPTLVVRGENSDILTEATLTKMAQAHPDLTTLTLRNRGHAPFLTEPGVFSEIGKILTRADAG